MKLLQEAYIDSSMSITEEEMSDEQLLDLMADLIPLARTPTGWRPDLVRAFVEQHVHRQY